MRYLKMFGLAALAAALMASAVVGTASATTIETEAGVPLGSGTSITAVAEGRTELHPPIGSIWCPESHVGGKTTNAGGGGINVIGNIESLSFTGCNATVTPIKDGNGRYGSLAVSWTSGSNGTLYGTGQEVTVVYLGFHCIFRTTNTKLGTVTGSATTGGDATLDIEAMIPRTSGSSGAFCGAVGTAAQWTGSYKVLLPTPLNITY